MSKIASINALASLVGKSPPAVQKWLKRPDWPFGAAPWPASKLEKIKTWAAETLQEDRATEAAPSGGDSDRTNYTRERALLTKVKRMREQVGLKADLSEYHDVATCRQAQITKINLIKNAMTTQLPRDIVRAIRSRDKAVGGMAVENDATEVVRQAIEAAMMDHLASGPTTDA